MFKNTLCCFASTKRQVWAQLVLRWVFFCGSSWRSYLTFQRYTKKTRHVLWAVEHRSTHKGMTGALWVKPIDYPLLRMLARHHQDYSIFCREYTFICHEPASWIGDLNSTSKVKRCICHKPPYKILKIAGHLLIFLLRLCMVNQISEIRNTPPQKKKSWKYLKMMVSKRISLSGLLIFQLPCYTSGVYNEPFLLISTNYPSQKTTRIPCRLPKWPNVNGTMSKAIYWGP